MPPPLSLAAGTLRPGTGAAPTVRIAGAVGFQMTGLRPSLTELTAGADEVRRALDETGISVLDVEVIRMGITPRDRIRQLIEFAGEVGAAHVLVVDNTHDRSEAVEQFGRICDLAQSVRAQPVLEFMRFSNVTDLPSATDLVRETGYPDAGVLIDALHLYRSGGSPELVATIRDVALPYVQICDAPLAGPQTEEDLAIEARHQRLVPGEGELPLRALLQALPGRPISVEVQSDTGWASGTDHEWALDVKRAAERLAAGSQALPSEPPVTPADG